MSDPAATTPSPLESATTEELIEELERRCRAVVVALERDDPHDPDALNVLVTYSGSVSHAIGLAERARDEFCYDARRNRKREK